MIGYAEENGETLTAYFQENDKWKKATMPVNPEQIYFMQMMLTEEIIPYVTDAKLIYSDRKDGAYIFKITFDAEKVSDLPFEKNLPAYMNNPLIDEIVGICKYLDGFF